MRSLLSWGSRLAYLESILMRCESNADRDSAVLAARATNQSCEAGADWLFAARMNQRVRGNMALNETKSRIFSGKGVL